MTIRSAYAYRKRLEGNHAPVLFCRPRVLRIHANHAEMSQRLTVLAKVVESMIMWIMGHVVRIRNARIKKEKNPRKLREQTQNQDIDGNIIKKYIVPDIECERANEFNLLSVGFN
jgi:hypothetical protein